MMLGQLAMGVLVGLALINGVNIVCNRVVNAKLGTHIGHLRSSYWNHLVGALFLLPLVFFLSAGQTHAQAWKTVPWPFYTGGIVGVVFVWMVNWTVPRLGALKATLILLSSQMICGLVLDVYLGKIRSLPMAIVGICIILSGAFLGKLYRK
ncbi:MAG: DMT family transporter [Deltaproteobacteria bacterium]|nr:DMT family transporter [Deltaproteobacteria bacterium]